MNASHIGGKKSHSRKPAPRNFDVTYGSNFVRGGKDRNDHPMSQHINNGQNSGIASGINRDKKLLYRFN
jgi:hypothetical protein